MKKIYIFFIILIILFGFIPSVRGQRGDASIYLSPSSGTFYVGSTFNISVFVNTGGNDINTVRVDLRFDPKKLQVASPTAGRSFISVWVSQPSYSNVKGTINFQGGMPSPGINTSSGLVSTITFRAVAPGSAAISIVDTSKVLLNDGRGTDILTSMGRGIYELTLPPPEGPKVFSPTHPDQNKWYKNNNPTLKWEREKWVTDFSYSIDTDFGGVPDNVSEGKGNSVSYTDLEDGIWYFHLKAKKGNVWGGVSHFILRIDSTPPAAFTLTFEPGLASVISTTQPIVSFVTTDALSGIDHYELKTISLSERGEEETEFFVEVVSPYRLSFDTGAYKVIVRAYDKARNYRDSSEGLQVIPRGRFVITKRGINFWIVFLPWWAIILILILLIAVVLVIVFLSRRYRIRIYQEREKLEETKKKADGHRDKIKKKYE